MAKKKIITTETPAEVSLIPASFSAPAAFVFPNKEESLKIIQAKKAENSKLDIADVSDKVNYDLVKTAMGEMKDSRIAFVNAATEAVINPVNKHLSRFKEDLEAVVNEFKAGEKDMRDKKDAIDDEKERLKVEKALSQQKAIEGRINNLFVLGAILDNSVYSFPYDNSLQIGSLQIAEFDYEEFGEFLEEVKTAWGVEQDRIAEEKRMIEEAEQEQAALAERNLEQAQQINEQAKLLVEKRTLLRMKELMLYGFKPTLEVYRKDELPHAFEMSAIKEMPDAVWEGLMEEIENYEAPQIIVSDALYEQIQFGSPSSNGSGLLEQVSQNIAEELEIETFIPMGDVIINLPVENISSAIAFNDITPASYDKILKPKSMNILALDVATKTGWCTKTAHGTWDFSLKRDESAGMRLVRFKAKLREMCALEEIKLVTFELSQGFHQNAVIVQSELHGVLKLFCEENKIDYRSFAPSEIKKFATGKGNANKEKMIEAAQLKYGYFGNDDNTADAMHIYHLTMKSLNL